MRFVRSLKFRGWALLGATAFCLALPGAVTTLGNSAHAGGTLEERKQPMHFKWNACQPDCRGWVSAVGIVTSDSPREFEEFAKGRQLAGATIVLDSSGGSVNDSIALGRRFRSLGALTTVGATVRTQTPQGERASVAPEAYCESMCVFLLLSGKTRYVPPVAHVRVHQIWMGDRADDAKAASYTAQDLMIVERDIGRLAKYTFDMGGTGDLLSLALSVPPWEDLHEMSRGELRLANLVTTDAVADVFPQDNASVPMAEAKPAKPQDRFVSSAVEGDAQPQPGKSTKTAEAAVPTGGSASRAGPAAAEVGCISNRRCHHPRKRMIQYAAASVIDREFPAYWMPAFAGMTTGMGGACPLRRRRLLRPGFDLADGVDHGVEGQHGRGVAGLVVAHRFEQGDVGPLALRGSAVFLQHLAHGFSQFT